MIFSYRTRQNLRRLLTVLLHIILVAIGLALCWLLWLQRFVIYTPEGVKLDFSLEEVTDVGAVPVRPDSTDVTIAYVGEKAPDQQEQEDVTIQMEWVDGYYVNVYTLLEDAAALIPQLQALPAGTPVLFDIKNYEGYFYYSSELGPIARQSHSAQVNELFAFLATSDLYTIARFPSLRDYDFGLNNVSCGIKKPNGYLWEDSNHCYWLDPTKDGTLSHLIQIIKELRSLGFDEVVLQNFQIPEGDTVNFDDRTTALEAAAQALVTACATDQFTVSFVASHQFTKIPESRSRLYLMDVAAADVADTISQALVADPDRQIVIIADTYDTRYDICNTLHPLDQAH